LQTDLGEKKVIGQGYCSVDSPRAPQSKMFCTKFLTTLEA
jgi:hypothetical protein